MRAPWLVAALGCGASSVDEPAPSCPVVAVHPADGAVVGWRSVVEVEIGEVDTEATLEVVDADGEPVPGIVVNDGAFLRFQPESFLAPSATYTLRVLACDGVATSTFTTSSLGAPLAAPGSLEETTFALDLSDGELREPAEAEAVLGVLLTSFPLLAGVRRVGEGSLTMLGALGAGDPLAQDPCSRTIDIPEFTFDNPAFSVEMRSFGIPYENGQIEVLSATLGGTFTADGERIEELFFRGTLDTRPLVPVFDSRPDAPASAVCDLLADTYGVSCVDCPGTAGEYCVDLDIVDASGARVPVPLAPWTADDVAAACADDAG